MQWASDFALDPSFVTSPDLGISGVATSPSILNVYVNNVLVANGQQVDSGPFRLQNLPVINGEGQVELVVRDSLGNERTISVPYYNAPEFLRRGVSDFSLEAGFERPYDQSLLSTGSGFFAASGRTGITDSLTASAVLAGDNLAKNAGLGFGWSWPRVGAFELGGVAGTCDGCSRIQSLLTGAYSFQSRTWNAGLNASLSSSRFAQVGSEQTESRPVSTTASIGYSMSRSSSLSLSYGSQSSGVDLLGKPLGTIQVSSLGYQLRLGTLRIQASATHTTGQYRNTSLAFNTMLPLGPSTLNTASTLTNGVAQHDRHVRSTSRIAGVRFGYYVSLEDGRSQSISLGADLATRFGDSTPTSESGHPAARLHYSEVSRSSTAPYSPANRSTMPLPSSTRRDSPAWACS